MSVCHVIIYYQYHARAIFIVLHIYFLLELYNIRNKMHRFLKNYKNKNMNVVLHI